MISWFKHKHVPEKIQIGGFFSVRGHHKCMAVRCTKCKHILVWPWWEIPPVKECENDE